MNILCIGDIVGKPGRAVVEESLPKLKKEYNLDFVIANAENSAGGAGLTSKIAKSLLRNGCDVLTLGDHVWDQKELGAYLDNENRVVRPANFPEGVPGNGYCIHTAANGSRVAVVNLIGRIFMKQQVDSPFTKLKEIVEKLKKQTNIIIVDFHAETTSEKVAMGHFMDGEISALVGTHTHIQTCDEKILSKKTAYITDLGMSGPYDSVIGQDKEAIIKRFLTSMPFRFQVAKDDVELHGVVIDVDEKNGRARAINRVCHRLLSDD